MVKPVKTDELLKATVRRRIEIILPPDITDEMLYYIADCWTSFVTQDLGYKPSEFLMILPDIYVS